MPEGQLTGPSLQILPVQLHQHREHRAAPSTGPISTRHHHEQTHEVMTQPTTAISSGGGGGGGGGGRVVFCNILLVLHFYFQSTSVFFHNLHNEMCMPVMGSLASRELCRNCINWVGFYIHLGRNPYLSCVLRMYHSTKPNCHPLLLTARRSGWKKVKSILTKKYQILQAGTREVQMTRLNKKAEG